MLFKLKIKNNVGEMIVDGNASGKTLLEGLVDTDRVHKSCDTSEEIFQQEIDNIFHKSWIYAGHESQIKNKGDFTTF